MFQKRREPVETIKVIMLRDAWGAPDGLTRTPYQAGETYDLPTDLAGCFFSTGDADPAEADMQSVDASQDATGAPGAAEEVPDGAKKPRAARRAKSGALAGV